MSGPAYPPPTIPDHEFRRYVSSGGFGDVFVYQDNMRRDVAIKVLHLKGMDADARAAFNVEAQRMANLGTRNRYVVTVYRFAIADDGRPYLSMEYCPDSLEGVIRRQRLAIAEVLRYAIQVASAVAAAHAEGLFHRDIKPANVLLTYDGQPALTDFGIAGGFDTQSAGARGLSLRYAAPEVISAETDGEVLADVYSLAATTYALLTGRAPFEVEAGDNSEAGLIDRTLSGRLAPTGRVDVPQQLERVLARGLTLAPEERFPTATAFARALQEVELELGFSETVVPLGESAIARNRTSGDDAEGTRFAAPQRVDPSRPATIERGLSARQGGPPSSMDTGRRSAPEPRAGRSPSTSDHTVHRPRGPQPSAIDDEQDLAGGHPSWLTRKALTAVAAATIVVVLGATLALLGLRGASDENGTGQPVMLANDTPADSGQLFAQPRVPSAVTVTRGGDGVRVSWNPDPLAGVSYVVSVTEGVDQGQSHTVAEPAIVLDDPDPDRRVCVRVLGVIGSTSSEPSREECTR